MSDQTDTTDVVTDDEPVTTDAQGATEETTHPWGDDFDPNRAWSTIQQQRAAEKALKEELAAERAVWEDEDAAEARVRQHFNHWFEDDEDDEPQADDNGQQPQVVNDPRVDGALSWIQQKQAQEALDAFNGDFDEIAGDRQVPPVVRDLIERDVFAQEKPSRDHVEQHLKAYFEALEAANPPKKNRAPHVPTGGPPAPEAPPAGHQARTARALERMQADEAL